jgi:hypothetical protein
VNEVHRIPLAALKVDQTVQQRVGGTAKKVVAEYAEAMRGGAAFPPPVVFSEGGDEYHLADGFHRVAAHRLAHPDVQEIECEVHPGGRNDALLFACGANASHGQRRSNADKRKAVVALLRSEIWSTWSDHEIARRCNVSQPFVGTVRKKHLKTFLDGRREENPPADTAVVPDVGATGAVSVVPRRPRKAKRGGKPLSIDTQAIGSGRKKPSPANTSASKPFLTPLAWSMATKPERVKFVAGVGAREIVETLKEIKPGFDILDRVWNLVGQSERQSFLRAHYEEISAGTVAIGIQPSEIPAVTKLVPKLAGDDAPVAPAIAPQLNLPL